MGDMADMAKEAEEDSKWQQRYERADKYPDGEFDGRSEINGPLHSFYIAGVKYHQYKNILNDITEGDYLMLIPVTTNKFDPNAVEIHFDNSAKAAFIGFVPKKFSSEISGLFEIGKRLECILTGFNKSASPWEMFKVEIREIEK